MIDLPAPVSDADEEVLTRSFRAMETVIGNLREHRRRQIGGVETTSRLVPFDERRGVSDLPLSDQLVGVVQEAKHRRLVWRGASLLKDPVMLALYPQLLAELRPATVIELGTWEGGSAAWLADMLSCIGVDAQLFSVDLDHDRIRVRHPRATYVRADLTAPASLAPTLGESALRTLPHPWLVIEDAHVNVYGVLAHFDRQMRRGDYVVAEDLALHRGKYLEVKRFAIDRGYLVDTFYTDMFGYNATWNPNGFLSKA